jgi:hypothetical protein
MAIAPSQITKFFSNHKPYSKLDPTQAAFFENLVVYIAKGCCPLSFIENP